MEGGGTLAEFDLERISMYIDILQRWNARLNLTAIRDEREIVTRHFGESLFVASKLFPHQTGTAADGARSGSESKCLVADVGSGAGFPGIPIKIWHPHIFVTLIEANYRKSVFLREVVRALELKDAEVRNERAESVPAGTFHLVTLRAVERFHEVLLPSAMLVKPAGRFALMIGKNQEKTARESLGTAVTWDEPISVPGSRSRVLLVGTQRGSSVASPP
jgi:16S rRNA (guanine527-N7)-methyltransferase